MWQGQVYVVIRVIFFSAVNVQNKKTVTSCNFFFCCKSCKAAYTTYRKKKLHDVTVFLLHAFTAKKKNLHDLP